MRGYAMRLTKPALCFLSVATSILPIHFALPRTSAQAVATNLPKSLSGEWILISIYETPNISGISPEKARSPRGHESNMKTVCCSPASNA
jgi:hypothetical protein